MILQQKAKKRALLMLILSIVLFLSALLLSFAVKNYYSPQKVTKRLSIEIGSAIGDLKTEIDKITQQEIGNDVTFSEYLERNYKNSFSERGLEILIYQNDTIKHWTSNVFSAPFLFDTIVYDNLLVRNGSGHYLIEQHRLNNYRIIAVQLLHYNYRYSNDYLQTGFFKRFTAPDNVSITLTQGPFIIKNSTGKFLFGLAFDRPFVMALYLQYFVFLLFISSFLFLVSVIYIITRALLGEEKPIWVLYFAFILEILILRAIQFHFQFPNDLYQIKLFNPAYFASSDLLPSLGDFLINSLLALQIVFYTVKQSMTLKRMSVKPDLYRILKALLVVFFFIITYNSLLQVLRGIVINSNISFRFENLLSLPDISHIGVLIIVSVLLVFILIFKLVVQYFLNNNIGLKLIGWISFTGTIAHIFFTFLLNSFDFVATLFLIAIFVLLLLEIANNSSGKFRLAQMLTLSVVLSAMATYTLLKSETIREHEKRKLLAIHLSDSRDNLAEYYFREASKSIRKDKLVSVTLSKFKNDSAVNGIANYIKDQYFSGYWDKYIVQITVCQKDKKLSIKPGNLITDCNSYFKGKIEQFMQPVSAEGLYFLKQSVDAMYYLGRINIETDSLERGIPNSTIFIEISSNSIGEGLGYPELLIDSKNTDVDNLDGYSYAFYYKGELVKNLGKYSFDFENIDWTGQKLDKGFYNSQGYSHLVFNIDKDTLIVLSKEIPNISDLISPFSYILLLLLSILMITNLLSGNTSNWRLGIYTLRLRLQVNMIMVIVVSSVVLVTVSLLFINKLNTNKNNEILNEKLNSILVDLETRYANISTFDSINKDDLSDLLLNFSNTYFTDINIFDTRGMLLASSRDQIFKEGMISEQINPASGRQLMIDKLSFFIQRENIGTYSFLSAYAPVRNADNQLLGFINLPYFARQGEIRREISGLISAFANIYIIMILITILLAVILSRYITKPLQQIGYQFSKVKIGDKNEKIEWTRKDEIGRLVDEYNRMIDEMGKSAELLARSERESAWRLMARQVAHEIKNPLTPIKLSMQLLMRAWNDKAPDWDARLDRFSQTLIMQIDTLSAIATEFSDFAQMPEPQIHQFDIIPIVQQSLALFRDQPDCEIIFKCDLQECFVKADPNQIIRVFNNLIKNALQAIPAGKHGIVTIKLGRKDKNCEIVFEDNGSGIPDEIQARIFSPNFTTKTAGMGLGLAMVKNILDNLSGRIWFETDPQKGSKFYILLPLNDPEMH